MIYYEPITYSTSISITYNDCYYVTFGVSNDEYAASNQCATGSTQNAASNQAAQISINDIQTCYGGLWQEWSRQYAVDSEEHRANLERIRLAEVARIEAETARIQASVAKREAAESAARTLLLQNLDQAQAAEFTKSRQFEVISRDGARRYRVEYGTAGNVKLLNGEGKPVSKFCIHPQVLCPTEDVMLAQKLLLDADEEEFLRIANRTAVA